MANADTPMGLVPVKDRFGGYFAGRLTPYYIFSTYGTALYIGDPVTKQGTANTAAVTVPGAGTFPIGTLPSIQKTTAGDVISDAYRPTGAIVAFSPSPTAGLDYNYNPASTERVAWVADDPNQLFMIQADGAVAAASMGLNGVFIYTNGGSTVTGLSGAELDTTSTGLSADASNQMIVLSAVNSVDNDTTITNPLVLVRLINHTEGMGGDVAGHGHLGV